MLPLECAGHRPGGGGLWACVTTRAGPVTKAGPVITGGGTAGGTFTCGSACGTAARTSLADDLYAVDGHGKRTMMTYGGIMIVTESAKR